jgi:hypothetical protein
MKPTNQTLAPYRTRTPQSSEKANEKKPSTLLENAIPVRKGKLPLGNQRARQTAANGANIARESDYAITKSTANEEDQTAEQPNNESSGSENIDDPNIIRVPAYLRTAEDPIDDTLTGSNVIASPTAFGRTFPRNHTTSPSPISLGRNENLEKERKEMKEIESLKEEIKALEGELYLEQPIKSPSIKVLDLGASSVPSAVADAGSDQIERLDPTEASNLNRNVEDEFEKALRKAQSLIEDKVAATFNKRGAYASHKKKDVASVSTAAKIIMEGKIKCQSFLSILPTGVGMDDRGNLSGTVLITQTPTQYRDGATPVDGKFRGVKYSERFDLSANGIKEKTCEIDGLEVSQQAGLGDLGRLNIELCYRDGSSFRSDEIDEEGMSDKVKARTKIVTHALNKFAGSPQALLVLSSIVHQVTVQNLQSCLTDEKGVASNSHLRIPKKNQGCTVLQNDGRRRQIDEKKTGIGSAKLKLVRDGADLVLSIDWQAYYMRQRDADDTLVADVPLSFHDAIGVHFYTELRINEAKAHDKILQLKTAGIQATFSGRLDWNAD